MKTDLINRSNVFAHKCVKLAINLPKNKLGSHIEGQLIRCSTSVAANLGRMFRAIKKSFYFKIRNSN